MNWRTDIGNARSLSKVLAYDRDFDVVFAQWCPKRNNWFIDKTELTLVPEFWCKIILPNGSTL